MRHAHVIVALLLAWVIPSLQSQQVTPEQIADAFLEKKTAPPLGRNLSFREALDFQKRYVELLSEKLGKPAGYKVGLVTRAGQERLGLSGPLRGVLLEKMLLPNNAAVSVNYGARPILEVDLMVRIKDAGINQVTTPAEALRHISEIVGFIELADGLLPADAPTSGPIITAINVGARSGVLGQTRKVETTAAFREAFAKMEMVMRDAEGKELSRSNASDIMGHPLNPLVWLVEDLRKNGAKLQTGDLVSLGSPAPQITPKAGELFTLTYEGFPGGPVETKVSITE